MPRFCAVARTHAAPAPPSTPACSKDLRRRHCRPAPSRRGPPPTRAPVGEMLSGMQQFIDVLVPRGGKSLVARVQAEARVPVIGHLEGNCHVYVDRDADLAMARKITLHAKMRRTGICGAAETLLVDRHCAASVVPTLLNDLLAAGCEVRGDESVRQYDERVKP